MATLKMKYGVISADDHVQEAPDVWTKQNVQSQVWR